METFRWEHLLSCPTSPTDPSSHALAIKHTNLVHLQVRCRHIPHKAFHINKQNKNPTALSCQEPFVAFFPLTPIVFMGRMLYGHHWQSAPKYHRIFITKQRSNRMSPHRKMYSYIIACHSYQRKELQYMRMGLFVGWVERCILGECFYVWTLDEIFPQQNATPYNSTALLLRDSAPCETTAQFLFYTYTAYTVYIAWVVLWLKLRASIWKVTGFWADHHCSLKHDF